MWETRLSKVTQILTCRTSELYMDGLEDYYMVEEMHWGAERGRGVFHFVSHDLRIFTGRGVLFCLFAGVLFGCVLCLFVFLGCCVFPVKILHSIRVLFFRISSCWPTMSCTRSAMQEKKMSCPKWAAAQRSTVIQVSCCLWNCRRGNSHWKFSQLTTHPSISATQNILRLGADLTVGCTSKAYTCKKSSHLLPAWHTLAADGCWAGRRIMREQSIKRSAASKDFDSVGEYTMKKVSIGLTLQEVLLPFATTSARTWVNQRVSFITGMYAGQWILTMGYVGHLLLAGITMSS